MPTTDLNQRVKRIIGLSDPELILLQTDGINSEDDLLCTIRRSGGSCGSGSNPSEHMLWQKV